MRKSGASSTSFDFIVASGKRSSMPHGTASLKEIEYGDVVTLDFGCIYEKYCSDMTRTVFVGKIDPKLKEIYDTVFIAQKEVCNGIESGVKCSEVDKMARTIIFDSGYGDNFTHGLGHGVGLEIHEKPTLSIKSEDYIRPGMIITIEPGIYVPEVAGVRIEDDIFVTADGVKVLTKFPKELQIVK
jgi:Xaa-Pro aminopeptidase